jgi:hypothetical protein
LILIKDTNSITDLIKQVIKIDNRIFQRERANKSNSKPMPVYRVLQQVQKLWYGTKPMDLSSIQKHQRKQLWRLQGQGP